MKFHNKEKLQDSDVCCCKGFARPKKKKKISQKTVQIFLKHRELVRVDLSDTTNHLRSQTNRKQHRPSKKNQIAYAGIR